MTAARSTPPVSERPRRKQWVTVALGVVVLLLLVVAAFALDAFVLRPSCGFGSGVALVDEQCIGVTDGSVDLSNGRDRVLSATVLNTIKTQNDSAVGSGNWVSIAYLVPFPVPAPGQSEAPAEPAMRHELEGAAAQQRAVNDPPGPRTRVRLLVANTGDSARHQHRVVPTLRDMASRDGRLDDDHLVGVIATGKSTEGTAAAIRDLVGAPVDAPDTYLPVVTSRLTADTFGTAPDARLARIGPTNSEQAVALLSAFQGRPGYVSVVRSAGNDPYVSSLGDAFRRQAADARIALLPDDAGFEPGASVADMEDILTNACGRGASTVLFAGRSPDLETLVRAAATAACPPEQKLTVATGSDAIDFATEIAQGRIDAPLRTGLAKLDLYYSALADVNATKQNAGLLGGRLFSGGALDPLAGVPEPDQADGAALMGNDAVKTVVNALPSTGPASSASGPDDVVRGLQGLNGRKAVAGASGWISLRSAPEPGTGAARGQAINKATPILQVLADDPRSYRAVSSVTGTPCRADDGQQVFATCFPPSR